MVQAYLPEHAIRVVGVGRWRKDEFFEEREHDPSHAGAGSTSTCRCCIIRQCVTAPERLRQILLILEHRMDKRL